VKWSQALDSERLVKTSTLQAALVPGQLNDGTPVSYAFGWGLGSYRGSPVVSHGGETDGFVAQITRIPEHRFTVILLSNDERFTGLHVIANKVADSFLADVVKLPAVVGSVPTRPTDYAGKFSLYDLALTVTADDAAVWLTAPGQRKVRLVHLSSDDFAVDNSQATQAPTLRFVRNSHGHVTCLTLLDQNGTMLCRH